MSLQKLIILLIITRLKKSKDDTESLLSYLESSEIISTVKKILSLRLKNSLIPVIIDSLLSKKYYISVDIFSQEVPDMLIKMRIVCQIHN